jgi:hypothetical protein
MVRNTYLELLYKIYLQLFGLKLINIWYLRSWTNIVCVVVAVLWKRIIVVLFGVLRGPCSDAPLFLLVMVLHRYDVQLRPLCCVLRLNPQFYLGWNIYFIEKISESGNLHEMNNLHNSVCIVSIVCVCSDILTHFINIHILNLAIAIFPYPFNFYITAVRNLLSSVLVM